MRVGRIKFGETVPVNVKILPCSIKHNGEVSTEGYLPDANECSFFGRKLQGRDVVLPENVSGYIAEGNTDMRISGTFTEIKYWNWDQPPEDSDQIQSLLIHMQVMKTLSENRSEPDSV